MRRLVMCCLVTAPLLAAGSASAGVLFQDDFSYLDGPLVGRGPWVERATGTAIGLSGGVVALGRTGQDAVAPVSSPVSFGTGTPAETNGYTFYLAADVNLSAALTGNYFLHTSGSTTSSSFQGRVYAKSMGAGFVLGTSVTSGTVSYGTTELTFGEPYRVVVEYNVVTGAMNDTTELFVGPAGTEPLSYASAVQSGSGDASAIGAVNLRQDANASSPNLTLDNLVVADDFAAAAAVPEPAAAGVVACGLAALAGRRRRRIGR